MSMVCPVIHLLNPHFHISFEEQINARASTGAGKGLFALVRSCPFATGFFTQNTGSGREPLVAQALCVMRPLPYFNSSILFITYSRWVRI